MVTNVSPRAASLWPRWRQNSVKSHTLGFVDGDGKCELKRDLGTTCLHPITASLTFSSQFQLKDTDILSMHVW